MKDAPLLEVHDLACSLSGGRRLFDGVGFCLRPGELLAIEGENSAGKTTLIRCLLKIRRPSAGSVRLRARPEEIAYLPQLGNVQFFLPLLVKDVVAFDQPRLERTEPRQRPSMDQSAILSLGLLSVKTLKNDWNTASGGERQRAMLTKVFLSQARLLVLDEPFNHLDRATRPRALELIRRRLSEGAAVIMVSHDSVASELPMAKQLRLGVSHPSGETLAHE